MHARRFVLLELFGGFPFLGASSLSFHQHEFRSADICLARYRSWVNFDLAVHKYCQLGDVTNQPVSDLFRPNQGPIRDRMVFQERRVHRLREQVEAMMEVNRRCDVLRRRQEAFLGHLIEKYQGAELGKQFLLKTPILLKSWSFKKLGCFSKGTFTTLPR